MKGKHTKGEQKKDEEKRGERGTCRVVVVVVVLEPRRCISLC